MAKSPNTMTKFTIFILAVLLIPRASNGQTSFTVIGHGYPVFHDSIKRALFIESLNTLETEAVFFLGDCDVFDSIIYEDFKQIEAPVYHSPGNHDLVYHEKRLEYLENVGYLDTTVVIGGINFLLVNSSETISYINDFIKDNLVYNDSTVNILLCHHRIWTDNKLSSNKYEHQKSYLSSELDTNLLEHVDYIISGNVNRIEKTYPKNIYWMDYFKHIICYSIGMGYNKTSYLHFKLENGLLVPIPKYVPVPNDIPVQNKDELLNHTNKSASTTFGLRKVCLLCLGVGVLMFLLGRVSSKL